MKKTYADKVVTAAKRGSALTLTADEVGHLVAEVGTICRVLLMLQGSTTTIRLEPAKLGVPLDVAVFGALSANGFDLDTDGKVWRMTAHGDYRCFVADTLSEVIDEGCKALSVSPPTAWEVEIDGAQIYADILEAIG